MTHGKLLELIEAARTDETAFSHLVHHVLDLRYALSNIAEDANEAAKKICLAISTPSVDPRRHLPFPSGVTPERWNVWRFNHV